MMRDTWVLFRHNLRITLRQKVGMIFGAIQPLFFLVLFGPIFATFGTWEVLVPGLIIQLSLLSTGMAGFGVVFERRTGVLERMRVTPAGRLALLLGTSMAALSYAIALTMDEQLFAPVMSTAVIPLALLSGSFLPMSMAPGWLDALSYVSPFRYAVEALRELFAGHYLTGTVLAGVVVTALFAVAGLAVGTRVFNRQAA